MLRVERPASTSAEQRASYRQRRPKETLLHQLVSEHLPGFLSLVEESYAAKLPRYVTKTLREYLACGDLRKGFSRYHCPKCDHDVLVGFSCKQRGVCPSCNTRRMSELAASMVDRTLPDVPLRQWVLSLPHEMRMLVALKPEVLSKIGRIFSEEVRRYLCASVGLSNVETGTVNFVQRFGGSLNLHIHLHMLAPDGAFRFGDGGDARGVVFLPLDEPPSRDDVEVVARRVTARVERFLKRRGFIELRPNEQDQRREREPTPLEAVSSIAMQGGDWLGRPFLLKDSGDAPLEKREPRFSAEYRGFNLHCAVTVKEGDDEGREKLLRYCARPAFALDRIEELKDGRIAYRVKTVRKGKTHRVMTGPEFLARLSALIPPPRYPLVRYGGVFAGASSWRALVVPKPRTRAPADCNDTSADGRAEAKNEPPLQAEAKIATDAPADRHLAAELLLKAASERRLIGTVTVKHWQRLAEGALYATSPNIRWSFLLKRSFGFDAEKCPRCDAKMRLLAVVEKADEATALLARLGLDELAVGPTVRRARDPTADKPHYDEYVQTDFNFGA